MFSNFIYSQPRTAQSTQSRLLQCGFSLVELSIVLVILGLLTGGILAGQSLIRAAELRATIKQIDQYTVAVRSFRDRYQYLPGDLPSSLAARLNFATRAGTAGSGNGDGILTGVHGSAYTTEIGDGEPAIFWSDLSSSDSIEGSYTTASGTAQPTSVITTGFERYFPPAKIGTGSYVYAWSGGKGPGNSAAPSPDLSFGISKISTIPTNGIPTSSATSFSVQDAWNIDTKLDDGKPLSGSVVAQYLPGTYAPAWVNLTWAEDPATTAISMSSLSCIDNGGVSGAAFNYTLSNASSMNCALSFRVR